MYEYKKEGKEYVLLCDGEEIDRTKEIAISYDDTQQGTVLLKHGDAARVQAWHDNYIKKVRDAGLSDAVNSLKIIRSAELPVEELNKCLQVCDYVGRMVKTLSKQSPASDGPSP